MPNTTVADRGSTRYTCQGGGPCEGALKGAVIPEPPSSSSAGQPLSAQAFAIHTSTPASVTRAASPSTTTSASRIETAIEQRESRATLRPFRVPGPVWNQNAPSSQRAPTAVTCGPPSSFTVASQVVRELCASGAGVDPASSLGHCGPTGGSPSPAPRLMISIAPSLRSRATVRNQLSYIRRPRTGQVIGAARCGDRSRFGISGHRDISG